MNHLNELSTTKTFLSRIYQQDKIPHLTPSKIPETRQININVHVRHWNILVSFNKFILPNIAIYRSNHTQIWYLQVVNIVVVRREGGDV